MFGINNLWQKCCGFIIKAGVECSADEFLKLGCLLYEAAKLYVLKTYGSFKQFLRFLIKQS